MARVKKQESQVEASVEQIQETSKEKAAKVGPDELVTVCRELASDLATNKLTPESLMVRLKDVVDSALAGMEIPGDPSKTVMLRERYIRDLSMQLTLQANAFSTTRAAVLRLLSAYNKA